MVISWPVPERASRRRIVQASSSVGTIFSIEATTICTLGSVCGEIAVSLIGDDHRGSGLGDQQVGAGDADIGGDELLAQHGARFGHEVRHRAERAIRREAAMDADEILGDLFLVEVDHRRDDVARRLAPDLDDVLAEIGLRHLDAGGFEMGVEADLFRHHGFALGDEARAGLLADLQDNVARVGGARRVMHLASALRHLPLIGFEIEVEMH